MQAEGRQNQKGNKKKKPVSREKTKDSWVWELRQYFPERNPTNPTPEIETGDSSFICFDPLKFYISNTRLHVGINKPLWLDFKRALVPPASKTIILEQRFPTSGDFSLWGTFGNSWQHLFHFTGCHDGRGTTSISWVEARDAAKHPTMLSLPAKNYLAQNVNNAEVKKLYSKIS